MESRFPCTQMKFNRGVLANRPIANSAWRPPGQLSSLCREYARSCAEHTDNAEHDG